MAPQQRYRLKLNKLQFCSLVDQPAQPNAKTLLIKRAPKGDKVTASARIAKLDEELGLAFFWAFTSTNADGSDHFDLQGDTVDQDFVKAAMEFMTDGGGAVDEMHSNEAGAGKVVFAFPMTPDIAKAFGVVTKTSGLMIAIKPGADQLAKLKDGTYNGVSIGGLGVREAIKFHSKKAGDAKCVGCGKFAVAGLQSCPGCGGPMSKSATTHMFARVLKEAVLTSEEDGHQHALDLDDPATGWMDMYSTSYQTAEGASNGHSHAWTFDTTTGAITIAADSGHTHTVDAVVPPDALAAWLALDAEQDARNAAIAAAPLAVVDDPSDGVPMTLPVEESSGVVVNVMVAARAPQSKSTPSAVVPSVKAQPETKPMSKLIPILLAMTASEQAYVGKLAPDEVELFLAKSAAERASIFKSADEADAVVFKGAVSGIEVRKSDGAMALQLAKINESNAATIAQQTSDIAKAQARTEQVELEKRAGESLAHFGKSLGVRAAILKAVEGISDETMRKDAIEALKGADVALKELGVAKGASPGEDAQATETPLAKFNKALGQFAKAANLSPQMATPKFLATKEGAELYRVASN